MTFRFIGIIFVYVGISSLGLSKSTADELYQKELDRLDYVKAMNMDASDKSRHEVDGSDSVQNLPFAGVSAESEVDVPEYTMESPEVDLVLKEDVFFINSQDSIENPQKMPIDVGGNSESVDVVVEDKADDADMGLWDRISGFFRSMFSGKP